MKLTLSDNLSLPVDFVTERIAFLARTGAGKSGGMRVLFEQSLNAKQFVIFIDPKGDAYGIRADGSGKGYPVLIMGGDHGDVPLEPTAGKFIAEFLVRERVSTVLDVSDFTTKDMWRFVADFTSQLYRTNREVCLVMIDEADMVAGEKYFDPHTLHGIQLIQNKGRHRGFGLVVATQRSAILNKTVLFASGTLIAMQTTGPNDIKAIHDWLKYAGTKEATEQILAGLPMLKNREAFVYSPQTLGPEPIKITFDSFTTFDSMRTPKPGETRQAPKSLADIDLSAIQRDMVETIEKVKAADPKLLQARIRQLQGDLKKAQSGTPNAVAEKVPIFPEKAIEDLTKEIARFRTDYISKLERIAKELEALDGQKTLNQIESSVTKLLSVIPNPVPTPAARVSRPVPPATSPKMQKTRLTSSKSVGSTIFSSRNKGC